MESRCESACCENRAPLVFGNFSIDMYFANLVDCNPSMLNHISCRKMILFPEWRGNLRIGYSPNPLVKSEDCQNSNQHPLYICTLLYVQLQSVFIHFRSLAVLCTWVYFLRFVVHAITQPIGMALNRSMQSRGKVTNFTCMILWWLQATKDQHRICLVFGLPMSRMGVEAPTCSSSSKTPAIVVHVLAEIPRPASRQLVHGMSVI